MLEGIVTIDNISFLLVFLEGVISFFSPCIIPLIPVYMSYLAGNAKIEGEDGTITYKRKKVFLHTVFFVIGISFSFFILGMTFTTLGNFFNDNKYLFTRIGGILIIVLGLFQLGIFDFSFLQKERKFKLNLGNKEVNPFLALIMGFTFSFAWTPCVGPMLSSVLIMASGAKTQLTGNLLVLLYTFGFILPFLLLGLFTTRVLEFLQSHKKLVKYTIKIGGVLLIVMGIMTFTGWMNGISSYLNSYTNKINESTTIDKNNNKDKEEETGSTGSDDATTPDKSSENTQTEDGNSSGNVDDSSNENNANSDSANSDSAKSNENESEEAELHPAIDFTLTDQYGNEHTLSDYKGKVVFLNFWATWCPPCREEMPHIEELYKEYNLNEDEVVFLGIANPKSEEYPYNQDEKKEDIIAFLDDYEYTFPTVFDETGEFFQGYYISAFPTTYMINKDGNILGYVAGAMSKDIMVNIINQTLQSTKN